MATIEPLSETITVNGLIDRHDTKKEGPKPLLFRLVMRQAFLRRDGAGTGVTSSSADARARSTSRAP